MRDDAMCDIEPSTPAQLKQLQKEARVAITDRTNDRKQKILKMMRHEEEHFKELLVCSPDASVQTKKGIERADVDALLGVSRKTALKYLNELHEHGDIHQIKDGRFSRYVLGI